MLDLRTKSWAPGLKSATWAMSETPVKPNTTDFFFFFFEYCFINLILQGCLFSELFYQSALQYTKTWHHVLLLKCLLKGKKEDNKVVWFASLLCEILIGLTFCCLHIFCKFGPI